MNIGSIIVITPYDSPVDYQPDWRHAIATAMADLVCASEIAEEDSDIILRHMRFMKRNRVTNDKSKLPKEYKDHKITFDWYADDGVANSFKYFLEALLLTNRTYKEIAEDLGITWQQVRLYEQLYYNIRDDEGMDKSARVLKLRFANTRKANQVGDMARYTDWKRVAASLGYNVLMALWGWHTHEDDIAIQRDLVAGTRALSAGRIIRGEINNFDINGLTKNYNDRLRLEHEKESANIARGQLSDGSSPLKSAWYMLLQDLGPRMVPATVTEEELRLKQAGLRNKLQAQQNINDVEVEDRGSQAIADFSASMRKQLTEGKTP